EKREQPEIAAQVAGENRRLNAPELDELRRHRRVASGAEPELRELDVLIGVDYVDAEPHGGRQVEPLLDRLAAPDRKSILIGLEDAVALRLAQHEIGVLRDGSV